MNTERIIAVVITVLAVLASYLCGEVFLKFGNNIYIFAVHTVLITAVLWYIPRLIAWKKHKTFFLYVVEMLIAFGILFAYGTKFALKPIAEMGAYDLMMFDTTILFAVSWIMIGVITFTEKDTPA